MFLGQRLAGYSGGPSPAWLLGLALGCCDQDRALGVLYWLLAFGGPCSTGLPSHGLVRWW
jgi:hypothetical protein